MIVGGNALFYTHPEDALHSAYFGTHGPITCEFGCGRAFVDLMSFSRHIHNRRCTAIPPPPKPSGTNEIQQNDEKDKTKEPHHCTVCSVTFDSRESAIAHFFTPEDLVSAAKSSGIKLSPHELFLLDKGLLWQCVNEWLSVAKFFPLQPSTGLLQAIRRFAPHSQRGHGVFVWRQSGYVSPEFLRSHRDTHIATARRLANEIKRLNRFDVQSLAVIAGQNVRATLMPNFSADRQLEIAHLSEVLAPAEYSTESQKYEYNCVVRASRSMDDIFNQLLRAHMRGLRPLHLSIGQNAFSYNWSRLSLFMQLYTRIYGPLDFAVLTPKIEVVNGRIGDTEFICPVDLGTYYAGSYRSTDIIDHDSGKKVNERLATWKRNLDTVNEQYNAVGHA
jgi:hypothetical protein